LEAGRSSIGHDPSNTTSITLYNCLPHVGQDQDQTESDAEQSN
jgi:hypothetical protein